MSVVTADPENIKIWELEINVAKYFEQVEVDPKTGRLVAKDRPTGALGAFAGTVEISYRRIN